MHLLQSLQESLANLVISRSFFETTGIDDGFLEIPVDTWENNSSFQIAENLVKNLTCVNDVAVVERHRKEFATCNRDKLRDI